MLSLFVQVQAEAEGAACFLFLRLCPCQCVSPAHVALFAVSAFPWQKGFLSPFSSGEEGAFPICFFRKRGCLSLESPPLHLTHYVAPKAKWSECHLMQTLSQKGEF